MILVSLCAETIKPVYLVNPVSRIAGDGRAEFFSTWGPDFHQKGGGRRGGGEGQVEQLNLCVETINSCGGGGEECRGGSIL